MEARRQAQEAVLVGRRVNIEEASSTLHAVRQRVTQICQHRGRPLAILLDERGLQSPVDRRSGAGEGQNRRRSSSA